MIIYQNKLTNSSHTVGVGVSHSRNYGWVLNSVDEFSSSTDSKIHT